MSHYPVKQVILLRRDLRNTEGHKIRTGKLVAQGAHAAMMWVSKRLQTIWQQERDRPEDATYDGDDTCRGWFSGDELAWIEGSFAKVVLGVDGEAELKALVDKALALGVRAEVVTDNGTTEFGGVPTVTCAALGPATDEALDVITGHLRPY